MRHFHSPYPPSAHEHNRGVLKFKLVNVALVLDVAEDRTGEKPPMVNSALNWMFGAVKPCQETVTLERPTCVNCNCVGAEKAVTVLPIVKKALLSPAHPNVFTWAK